MANDVSYFAVALPLSLASSLDRIADKERSSTERVIISALEAFVAKQPAAARPAVKKSAE